MLWEAGHERVAREQRSRMAELFLAARDAALDVGVSTGELKPKGSWQMPSYVPGPDAEQREAIARRGLRQLMADFPSNVAPGREFTN